MRKVTSTMVGLAILAVGSLALAQTGGGEMMGEEAHRYGYGMMGGYMGLWFVYGLIKAVVVIVGLWALLRIARGVEKIAASK